VFKQRKNAALDAISAVSRNRFGREDCDIECKQPLAASVLKANYFGAQSELLPVSLVLTQNACQTLKTW